MRKLTPKEISKTPEWATHYFVDKDDNAFFESEDLFMSLTDGCVTGPLMKGNLGISEDAEIIKAVKDSK